MRRAGLVLVACLGVHDKAASDEAFEEYFSRILIAASDGRRMVWKGASWALRQIGKRNARLHGKALALAGTLLASDSRNARGVGREVTRELQSPKVLARLGLD